jgi:hypothetical protein
LPKGEKAYFNHQNAQDIKDSVRISWMSTLSNDSRLHVFWADFNDAIEVMVDDEVATIPVATCQSTILAIQALLVHLLIPVNIGQLPTILSQTENLDDTDTGSDCAFHMAATWLHIGLSQHVPPQNNARCSDSYQKAWNSLPMD